MAGSVLGNYVDSHTVPEEVVQASFTLSTSVASVAHSFTASFSGAPLLVGAASDTDDRLDFWVTSNSASGATLNIKGDGASTASINATFQFKPDLT